jgi:hypothetical protein
MLSLNGDSFFYVNIQYRQQIQQKHIMWNVECGMWNVECGMWNVECGNGLTANVFSFVHISCIFMFSK